MDTPRKSPNSAEILNDLEEIKSNSINIWSRDQKILEIQALTEIEKFSKKSKEESELSDHESTTTNSILNSNTLDINGYIKRQDELKRQLQQKRAASISEKSKNVANKINLQKVKRKIVEEKPKKLKKIKIIDDVISSHTNNVGLDKNTHSDSEYFPSDADSEDSDYKPVERQTSSKKSIHKSSDSNNKTICDDGNSSFYKKRMDEYYKSLENETSTNHYNNEEIEVCSGFKINSRIWDSLYGYQQEAVEWLYELHEKSSGGLLGDEMGLGKTVQVIAFLYGLNHSRIVSRYCRYTGLGPTIIICPTTVIHQWVQHFHEWAPELRVAVLHQTGSYTGNKLTLIKQIFKEKGIIVSSYLGILKYKGYLLELDWHYIILDEGHKIRNPSAKISVAVKQFRTPHKLMLTGSPMQNNLQELWSLFDFICPSVLGTLPVFMEHFAVPIMQGGYSNATPIQETTALLMATTLKSMITPYLLRRSKEEVRKDICLPQKSEQVLFCSLTDEQYDLYKGFLMSEHVNSILGRGGKNWFSENRTRANVLVAITTLRKICNHPDVYLLEADEQHASQDETPIEECFGYYKRSGKMIVVSALLKIWKKQKHRTLLFTQGRVMVEVLEIFLQQQSYKFLKMDGSTSIKSRQSLINTFNQDTSYDVFLLTTRVGGLGVNLTGADRVIIYDPDWNPATDTQARERAWRIGQERQVTIYRLISAGTIEEKMYQRQVWKQLLSNKVLLDPKTQKFFKTSDLHDLFSIQDRNSSNSETANIFKNSRISMERRLEERKAEKKKKHSKEEQINFSDDKVEKMKKLAQEIAKNIGKASDNSSKKEKKSAFEIELEQEKEMKSTERRYMKTLTPQELMDYNRKKSLIVDDTMINKVDDIETEASFSKALEVSEGTSNIYHKMKEEKLDVDNAQRRYESLAGTIKKTDISTLKKSGKKKFKERKVIDHSGKVDGESVEFLVKTETKFNKKSEKKNISNEAQDQYVLEKLFSRKGVHTALQHDVIVDSKTQEKPNRFRLQAEAQTRTELALQALQKSRLDKWRW